SEPIPGAQANADISTFKTSPPVISSKGAGCLREIVLLTRSAAALTRIIFGIVSYSLSVRFLFLVEAPSRCYHFDGREVRRRKRRHGMRVLQIHDIYQQKSGEEAVLAAQATLLGQAGCTVAQWTVSNDAIAGPLDAAKVAWRLPYSRPARAEAERRIRAFAPDIVHVHNFFPLITPSVYDACATLGVPAVQTLHNFRTICAGVFLFRDGVPCELCVAGSPWNGALHRCYRGSLLGSAALARMIAIHRRRGTWTRKVARFIAVSDFARGRFVAAGFPADRIAVVPNFAPEPVTPDPAAEARRDAARAGALFVGRLSAEKGIGTLMAAWEEVAAPLRVAGDMDRAAILVAPSEWPEVSSMALIEGLACGLPAVAARIGGIPEIVEDEVTGLLVPPRDPASLAAAARRLFEDMPLRRMMGASARLRHRRRFSPEPHLRALLAVYEAALAEGAPGGDRPAARHGGLSRGRAGALGAPS